MRYQDNPQPQFNSSYYSHATSFLCNSLDSYSISAYDDLQNELESLKNELPRQYAEIDLLLRYVHISKTFENATPSQKACLSLHICGSRKAKKRQFTFYHNVKAYLSNYSVKTMQRGNLFWEKNRCIRKADRKKKAWNKTENHYHKEKVLEPLRVVGGVLMINHFDDFGKKYFIPLLEFINIRLSSLKKLNENRKSFVEKTLVSQRQCPPNYTVLKSICISTDRSAQMRQKLANSVYIEKKLSAGIRIPGKPKLLPIPKSDIQKFVWYEEGLVMDAISAIEDMSPKSFAKIRSPIAYMLIVCKNAQKGNTSWKKHTHT